MRAIPLALLLGGLLVAGLGAYLPSFATLFFGLTLLCLVPIRLGRRVAVATVAASIFATLLVLEVVLAMLLAEEPPATRPTGDRFRKNEVVTDLGDLPAAGTYQMQQVTRDGETLFDVTYTIGADGFRLTPEPPDADAGRLNLFGGSFAFGHGVEDDETLAFELGRALGAEARNFGINGGGPHQALAILESGRDTQGSINILLTAAWHGERIACGRPWSGGSPRYRLDENGLVRDGVCPEEGVEPLHRTLRQSMIFDVVERANNVLWQESIAAAQLDLYVAVIERMAELSRARGQAFVIAYIGADSVRGVPLDNAALMRRLAATGASVVDVSLAQSPEQPSPDYYIHEFDNHPTALANEHRAELLAPVIDPILKQQASNEKAPRPDIAVTGAWRLSPARRPPVGNQDLHRVSQPTPRPFVRQAEPRAIIAAAKQAHQLLETSH